jgi:hypothetical protein
MNILSKFIVGFYTIGLLSSCATQYDRFAEFLKMDLSEAQFKDYLETTNTPYTFYTCEKAKEFLGTNQKECKYENSVGLYRGLSNDGSYMLGMGSSDVSFEVEIGANHKVVDIRSEYVYTFL